MFVKVEVIYIRVITVFDLFIYFLQFVNFQVDIVVCRRRELFVAPAVSLLNNSRAEFDTSKVGKITNCVCISRESSLICCKNVVHLC